jgi:hypothetical protein
MLPSQEYPASGPHIPFGDIVSPGEALEEDTCVPPPDDCPPGPRVSFGDGVILSILIAVEIEIADVSAPIPLPLASLIRRADN